MDSPIKSTKPSGYAFGWALVLNWRWEGSMLELLEFGNPEWVPSWALEVESGWSRDWGGRDMIQI